MLKLKAWDNVKKCFVSQYEIVYSDYGETSMTVIPNDVSYIGDSIHNGEPQRNRFQIIRCANISDKQNILLCEGDLREIQGKLYKLVDDGWRFRFERNMVEFGENHDIVVEEDTAYISILRGNIFVNKELLYSN